MVGPLTSGVAGTQTKFAKHIVRIISLCLALYSCETRTSGEYWLGHCFGSHLGRGRKKLLGREFWRSLESYRNSLAEHPLTRSCPYYDRAMQPTLSIHVEVFTLVCGWSDSHDGVSSNFWAVAGCHGQHLKGCWYGLLSTEFIPLQLGMTRWSST